MPKTVSYVTKVMGLRSVIFTGKLEYDFDSDSEKGWCVDGESIEPFLEKLAGQHVTLSIQGYAEDESHLLPEEEEEEEQSKEGETE